LTLLATLCIATAAVRAERYIGANPAESASQRIAYAPDETPVPTSPGIDLGTRREVEALAVHVAKKYRIAPEASRGLVATTYREGERVGLDPLLILAVIAVESRFNPIAAS